MSRARPPRPAHLISASFALAVVLGAGVFFLRASAPPGPPVRGDILVLLQDGKFSSLEAMLTGYETKYEDDHSALPWTEAAFRSFANSDSALEPRLNAWIEKMPNSYAARLARASFLGHLGALSRGGALAADTPRERFEDMRDFNALAAKDYTKAIALDPKLTLAYAGLADMARISGARDEAQHFLAEGLRFDPKSPLLHWTFLLTLEPKWGGSLTEIRDYLAALKQRYPADITLAGLQSFAEFVSGDAALRGGDYEGALNHFDRAIASDGARIAYLEEHADADFMRDHYEDASAAILRALALDPDDAALHYRLSEYRLFEKRLDAALASADKAVGLDRLNPTYLDQRATVLRMMGRHEEAVRDLDDAAIYGGFDARIQIDRSAELLRFETRLKDSVSAARRATELAPHDADAWAQYVQALWFAQDCGARQALQVFNAVCHPDSDCAKEHELIAPSLIPMMDCHGS